MERIIYRKTLDTHKNGIQFMIQGFETADNLSRVIEVSLMASGDAIDFPLEQMVAMMYVTTPSATEPSINACTIKDNKVIYDVLPIVEEGITTMQLKLIETSPEGARRVLCSPKFAVEVAKSDVNDEGAEQTTSFTALEEAVAKAKGTYDERLLRVEVDEKLIFKAYYADGSVYETDAIKEALYHGNALLSKSYAVGDTGVREGEASDNSKYYSNVSRSSSVEAREDGDYATDLLMEVRKHGVYTSFNMDFETGELIYASPSYNFTVDQESGELQAIGKDYNIEEVLEDMVAEDIADDVAQMISATLVQAKNDLPDVNPNIAVYVDDLTKDFTTPTLVSWDSKTAFTPYASGLTTNSDGFAIVHGQFTGNHTIIAWVTGEEDNYFCHTVSGGVAKGWNGFLPKSGGILSGSLGVGGGKGSVSANEEKTILSATKDENNSRQISIENPLTESAIEDAAKISEIIKGVKTDYKLFGEHNFGFLSGLVGNVQIESGSYKGIGYSGLISGKIPSIEFKTIIPELVIITGGQGVYFFVRPSTVGLGFKQARDYGYSAEWEGKTLKWTHAWYYTSGSTTSLANMSSENGARSYPDFLADNNETYYYIGFGKVGGAN